VGRPVELAGHPWLDAPVHTAGPVGDGWLDAAAHRAGGSVVRDDAAAGLLPDLAALDGPGFTAASLHPLVRDFYEHTAGWRMDAWSQWSPVAAPGGSLIARAFGRRVQQLAIPVRPLDVSRGIDSRVLPVLDAAGEQVWAGWLRRLRATDDVLFSGAYRSSTVPGHDGPCVHVAFPLERGNVQVLLAPTARADGALVLDSGPGRFGAPGAYVVVLDPPRTGAGKAICAEVARLRPRAIAYVACDPAALARDTAILAEAGYRLDRVRAFDAFPMTHHVECVGLFTRDS
jgi:hypothetical protein